MGKMASSALRLRLFTQNAGKISRNVGSKTSNISRSTQSRTVVSTSSGAILPKPEKTPFGLIRMTAVVVPFLYVGTLISKNFAALLEEHDIFCSVSQSQVFVEGARLQLAATPHVTQLHVGLLITLLLNLPRMFLLQLLKCFLMGGLHGFKSGPAGGPGATGAVHLYPHGCTLPLNALHLLSKRKGLRTTQSHCLHDLTVFRNFQTQGSHKTVLTCICGHSADARSSTFEDLCHAMLPYSIIRTHPPVSPGPLVPARAQTLVPPPQTCKLLLGLQLDRRDISQYNVVVYGAFSFGRVQPGHISVILTVSLWAERSAPLGTVPLMWRAEGWQNEDSDCGPDSTRRSKCHSRHHYWLCWSPQKGHEDHHLRPGW
ncbi:hypothetical protein F7725_005571 [Dissostichus mawsoni]|uniref:Essential MCU regulator, mitochondrial n=1 Tax=Dissostichus mawsoni TaxID=36200 RepID=A0A7J5YRT3_DISMA|nr:hypothetical protein F7725_005571 [Dissostichus mawsoni]